MTILISSELTYRVIASAGLRIGIIIPMVTAIAAGKPVEPIQYAQEYPSAAYRLQGIHRTAGCETAAATVLRGYIPLIANKKLFQRYFQHIGIVLSMYIRMQLPYRRGQQRAELYYILMALGMRRSCIEAI